VLGARCHGPGPHSDRLTNQGGAGHHAAATLRLSSREREILQLIAEGRATKEMAHGLNISTKTVAFHRENIKRKLGLRTTAELTKHAIEQGLV
jgi:DNA-binding CsgD family transcriptional regulator